MLVLRLNDRGKCFIDKANQGKISILLNALTGKHTFVFFIEKGILKEHLQRASFNIMVFLCIFFIVS
jgi:hypothetical protein